MRFLWIETMIAEGPQARTFEHHVRL
jgi:hypothetical protein